MTLEEFRNFEHESQQELDIMRIRKKNVASRMEQAETEEEFNSLIRQYRYIDDKLRESGLEYLKARAQLIYEMDLANIYKKV